MVRAAAAAPGMAAATGRTSGAEGRAPTASLRCGEDSGDAADRALDIVGAALAAAADRT